MATENEKTGVTVSDHVDSNDFHYDIDVDQQTQHQQSLIEKEVINQFILFLNKNFLEDY
jgi:hypothetical protein